MNAIQPTQFAEEGPKMDRQNRRRRRLLELSQSALGRVRLHLMAWQRDGNLRWHLAGVIRELLPS